MKTLTHYFKKIISSANRKTTLLIAAASLIVLGWAAVWIVDLPLLFDGLMIAATLLAGSDIGRRAWQGLRNKHTNIDLLVSIAAIGGLAIGVYWESAAVTFLFLLGGWLEARTLNKTRSTLKELINLAPDTAIIIKDDEHEEIPARNVKKNALVLVKPGGKIPVDGAVESGSTTVDESAVTGEPLSAKKQEGAQVCAGTINQNGRIYVRTNKAGGDTTLAKIIRRVEEAQEEKAPTQRFIERFASWYTPGIVGLSIASYLFTWNLELALTLLVIGCPGALVISTPISIITGIGRAAKKGMLIKGGEYLEDAGKITAIAMDKTGTLTEDKAAIIRQLQDQGHQVAMVGDGINDAPALATADIGIAMGAAGTDVAIETADIALMADELMKIPEALRLSKKTLRNIRQNVVIALLTVTALLAGVFAGSVHMAGGMLIHELSVMIVILNGMRLRWA